MRAELSAFPASRLIPDMESAWSWTETRATGTASTRGERRRGEGRQAHTHVGIVARLDGVVALQLSPGPVGLALRAPQVAPHAVMVGKLHGLPCRAAFRLFGL